jgi:hypothetical protein
MAFEFSVGKAPKKGADLFISTGFSSGGRNLKEQAYTVATQISKKAEVNLHTQQTLRRNLQSFQAINFKRQIKQIFEQINRCLSLMSFCFASGIIAFAIKLWSNSFVGMLPTE